MLGSDWPGDAQHLGAVSREAAPADRPGEHARKVEHAHATERPHAVADLLGGAVADAADLKEREAGDGAPLLVVAPLLAGAHERGAPACGDDLRLEALTVAGRNGRRDGLALVRGIEDLERGVAVVHEVRVQADPAAVGGLVEPGDRVPERRWLGIVEAQITLATEDRAGVAEVDRDGLCAPRALRPELTRREACRADRGGGCLTDAKHRGQRGVDAAERDSLERCGVEPGAIPEPAQRFVGVHTSILGELRSASISRPAIDGRN